MHYLFVIEMCGFSCLVYLDKMHGTIQEAIDPWISVPIIYWKVACCVVDVPLSGNSNFI